MSDYRHSQHEETCANAWPDMRSHIAAHARYTDYRDHAAKQGKGRIVTKKTIF
jgi:hypothetical protein